MAHTARRKAALTLYCYPACLQGHRVRMALNEKGIMDEVDCVYIQELPDELLEVNPYGSTPTLVDRDLVLYQTDIILDYLDERFPHPPLHPMEPVSRARSRLLMHRIQEDWYSLYNQARSEDERAALKARKTLRDSLIAATPVFAAKPYFLSDDFTLVDCTVAPLLWNLTRLQIELPKQAEAVRAYARRIFERPTFQASLADLEKVWLPSTAA